MAQKSKKAKKAYRRYKQQIKYMIFGFLTTVVNMATYYLLMMIPWFSSDETINLLSEEYAVGYLVANLIAYVVAMVFSYAVNRNFVFGNKVYGKGAVLKQFFLFLATRLAALVVEEALLFIAVEHLDISKFVAKWPVAIFMVLINYPLGKLVVFRDRSSD